MNVSSGSPPPKMPSWEGESRKHRRHMERLMAREDDDGDWGDAEDDVPEPDDGYDDEGLQEY